MNTHLRTALAAVLLLLAPVASIAGAGPAAAAYGWAPDEVLVVDVPVDLLTAVHAEAWAEMEATGVQVGDVLQVQYLAQIHDLGCQRILVNSCAYWTDAAGELHPLPDDFAAAVPYGASSADGSVYPEYTDLVAYNPKGIGFVNVQSNDPNGSAPLTAAGDAVDRDIIFWRAQADGSGMARVGVGIYDIWVDDYAFTEPDPSSSYYDGYLFTGEPPIDEDALDTPDPTTAEVDTAEPDPSVDTVVVDAPGDGAPRALLFGLGGLLAAAVVALAHLIRRTRSAEA